MRTHSSADALRSARRRGASLPATEWQACASLPVHATVCVSSPWCDDVPRSRRPSTAAPSASSATSTGDVQDGAAPTPAPSWGCTDRRCPVSWRRRRSRPPRRCAGSCRGFPGRRSGRRPRPARRSSTSWAACGWRRSRATRLRCSVSLTRSATPRADVHKTGAVDGLGTARAANCRDLTAGGDRLGDQERPSTTNAPPRRALRRPSRRAAVGPLGW